MGANQYGARAGCPDRAQIADWFAQSTPNSAPDHFASWEEFEELKYVLVGVAWQDLRVDSADP